MIESAVTWLLDMVREHGPLLLFLTSFLENAAFLSWLLPGEKMLLVGGYLVQQGQLRFEIAWLSIFLGVILGDSVGYLIGRFGGARIVHRLPGRQAISRVEQMLERHGGWVVLIGRFSGFLRPVLFFTVGMMKVPFRRFWLYEMVGAAAWTTVWLGMGVLGGELIEYLGDLGQYAVWAIAFKVATFALGGGLVWKYRERIKSFLFGDKAPSAEKAAQPAA